jgi:hypothetical protein
MLHAALVSTITFTFKEDRMNIGKLGFLLWLAGVAPAAQSPDSGAQALSSGNIWSEEEVAFELIGQVKNSPPAGPGLPATSVQYGYLPYINDLTTEQVFAPGGSKNETTALFTFYNDSVTVRVVPHGRWTIVTREGTMTIYHDDTPDGDLTTPNPDSFRDGRAVLTSTWRHQVIFEAAHSGLFFVTFENKVTSVEPFFLEDREIRLAKIGDRYRMNLVGGLDPAGLVNGKFAGTATALGTRK